MKKLSAASIPAKRYGTPEEFAAVTVFLASEPAGYVTGSMIRIDGGLIKTYIVLKKKAPEISGAFIFMRYKHRGNACIFCRSHKGRLRCG